MSLRIYEDLEQRSDEWYAARCGLVTASAIGSLVVSSPPPADSVGCSLCGAVRRTPCTSLTAKKPTPIKTYHPDRIAIASVMPPVLSVADNETSRKLVATLAAERITGHVEETRMTADMWRGVDSEPYARDAYAEHMGEPVKQIGFAVRDFGGFSIGYSPDGLVGDDGLLETKAPRQSNHLTAVVSGEVPTYYMAQLQTGLLVMGREWIDYTSYCGGMHLWPKRVTPDSQWQAAIIAAAEQTEKAIRETVAAYEQAVVGLPLTERIDFNTVELKLA